MKTTLIIKSVFRIVISLALTISLFSGCSKMDNNNNGNPIVPANEVYIQGMAFSPATLTVNVNTTVKWTNKDDVSHTVTSDSPLFDSGSLANSGTFSFMFTSAGTFNYHCSLHPSMTAKVIVN